MKIKLRQRFGFFSISYGTHIGDRNYSKSKTRKIDEEGKVITSPRGIFTKPGKKGIVKEAFFIDMITQEKETLNKIKEINKENKKAFIEKINSRKKINQKEGYKPSFKPASSHGYED